MAAKEAPQPQVTEQPQYTIHGSHVAGEAAPTDLDGILKDFKPTFLRGTNSSSDEPEVVDNNRFDKHGNLIESEIPPLESTETEDSTEEEEADEEETDSEPTAFDKEFEQKFGLPIEEARETINSLIAFKDEMKLMREWGVSPVDYDKRITAVRDFFKDLPKDKQSEFDSPEGAKAIWEHLSKNNPKATNQKKQSAAKREPAPTKIRKSDILRMNNAEYQRRLPEITAAFRKGLIIEDV
jgi:hypothetical protein